MPGLLQEFFSTPSISDNPLGIFHKVLGTAAHCTVSLPPLFLHTAVLLKLHPDTSSLSSPSLHHRTWNIHSSDPIDSTDHWLYIRGCSTLCFPPMVLCTQSLHEQLPCIAGSSAGFHWNMSRNSGSMNSIPATVRQLDREQYYKACDASQGLHRASLHTEEVCMTWFVFFGLGHM